MADSFLVQRERERERAKDHQNYNIILKQDQQLIKNLTVVAIILIHVTGSLKLKSDNNRESINGVPNSLFLYPKPLPLKFIKLF